MDVLFILVSLLLPCTSYLEGYYPRRNKLQLTPFYNDISQEIKEGFHRPASSPLEWLRKKKKNKTEKAVLSTILPENPTLNMSIFSIIRDDDERGAKQAADGEYPWSAQVVHSTEERSFPYLCTAACIEERIFITAARCIYQAKVLFTTVHYLGHTVRPIAFVTPSKPTAQMFDDIGFIIVKHRHIFGQHWTTIKVFDDTDNNKFIRTDDHFLWLANLGVLNGTAVGFVRHDMYQPWGIYHIPVSISPFLCQHLYNIVDIFKLDYKSDDFFVPCYHTCTLHEAYTLKENCFKRLAGEGHVIIEQESGKLIGIATWAGYYDKKINRTLPIGMAVPNSENYKEDLQCARKIKDAPETSHTFANLC